MNPTLITAFWRQRAVSPIRVVILFFMVTMPLIMVAALPAMGLAALGEALPIGMLFAAGMIGQDVGSGVLQLVFARPVRRWEYVMSRWLAVGIAAAAAIALQAGGAWGVLALRGHAPEAEVMLAFAGGRVLQVFGGAAVMALLSSLASGLGDLAIYILLNIVGGLASVAGQAKGWSVLTQGADVLRGALAPAIDFDRVAAGGPHAWLTVVAYLSTIALCLALASEVMNRRQLSYASGG